MKLKSVHKVSPFGREILQHHPDNETISDDEIEHWFITSFKNTNDCWIVEEIYWKGHVAIVSSVDVTANKYYLKRCYSVETPIKDIVYTNFSISGNTEELPCRCLCILEKESITIYPDTGNHFVAALPFKVKKIWSSENGLFVEREILSNEMNLHRRVMPSMFTLTHPLDDFKPVVYRQRERSRPMYFLDTSHQLIFSFPEHSFALMYDSALGLHSLWTVRKAGEKDYPNADLHNESLPDIFEFSNILKDTSRFASPSAGNKRHSCPPISLASAAQRKNSPARLDSPKIKSPANIPYMSSPAVRRLGHESINTSDSSLQRSSLLSSRMIRVLSVNESILEDDLDPLPPDICFEQIWQEPALNLRHGVKGKAISAFMTKDFSGKQYLGFHLQHASKLRLLEIKSMKDGNYTFEKLHDIECLNAGALMNGCLIIVLDMTQNLQLFSGKQKISSLDPKTCIGNLDLSSLKLNLLHFINNSFMLSIKDGDIFRVELLDPPHTKKITQCIELLKSILSPDEYNLVYGKFFKMICFEESLSENIFDKFVYVALKLLGFPEACVNSLKPHYKSPAPPDPKKPKKSQSSLGEEDWNYVLNYQNDFLCTQRSMKQKYIAEVRFQKHAPLFKHFTYVFSLWTSYYEELKLSIQEYSVLFGFAQLLHYISRIIGLKHHIFLFEQDFPRLSSHHADTLFEIQKEDALNLKDLSKDLEKISLYDCILKSLQRGNKEINFSSNFKYTNVITKVYTLILTDIKERNQPELIMSKLDITNSCDDQLARRIVNTMIENDFMREDLDKLPIGYKLPILNILHRSNNSSLGNTSLEMAKFFGRDDIVEMKKKSLKSIKISSVVNVENKSGMEMDEELFRCRFREDLRIDEVKKLLNSSDPVQISLVQKPDVNDHNFAKEEEATLSLISNRTMALPLGRGMLTIDTSKPIASKTVFIPKLDITGKSSTSGKTVTLPNENVGKLNWPHFHNGVAAGLRIAPSASKIGPAWILFNRLKTASLTAEHSGFLFALGFTGHLKHVPKLDLHDYLIKGHELTTIALLIGSAAAQIGSQDSATYKLTCLHLDSLLPPTALDLNIPALTQVAAIISVGLLFFQSDNLYLVKTLLYEIGRSPTCENDQMVDVESHSLSAGLALGMILMGKGKESMMVADINIASILYRYIVGGQKNDKVFSKIQMGKKNASNIEEGSLINTNVTSSAAIVALSMMYFKTGNRRIADWLNVPLNVKVMDSMEPDSLLLRVVGYCFIMWNDVIPTEEWLLSILSMYDDQFMEHFTDGSSELEIHYYVAIVTGCLLALSLKYASTCNSTAFSMMRDWLGKIEHILKTGRADKFCAKIFTEKCLRSILLSLSVLMAGSGNIFVLRKARKLHKICTSDVTYGMHLSMSMTIGFLFLGGGRYGLKTDDISIACMFTALYPRWPITSKDNRFHMQALRHLYFVACEPRLLWAYDIDTKKHCYVPIDVTLRETDDYDETTMKYLSPCLLPELRHIKKIEISGSRYLPITINIDENFSLKDLERVYVKKKVGCLSYSEDPQGKKNLLARTFKNPADELDLINSLNSSEKVALFEKIFCSSTLNQSPESQVDCSEEEMFYLSLLHDCVTKEKLDLMKDFILIEKMMKDIESSCFYGYKARQLIVLLMFLEVTYSRDGSVSRVTLMQLRLRLTNIFERLSKNDKNVSNCMLMIKEYLGGNNSYV